MKRTSAWQAFLGRGGLTGSAIVLLLIGVTSAAGVLLARRQALELQRERAFAIESGDLAVRGLAAPVEILRDARGVPHIQAVRDDDAWLSLGFTHAQDRLAQMLWLRRLARGRTAEVVGPAGLPADRLARTLGIGMLADAQVSRLDPDTLAILSSYAAGVNARIDRVRNGQVAAPVSLAGPVGEIVDWRPADSVALLKLVAWSASNSIETGLVLDDLIQHLGSQLARPFRPTGAGVRGVQIAGDLNPAEIASTTPVGPVGERANPSRELVRSTAIRGGTAWVLGGRYTESGAPILVADLHLPTTVPSLLYEVHLRGGGVDLAGATIPGMPVVWAGRNLYTAWAAIPARAVTVDLYKETIRADQGVYQNGSRWVPLVERREVVRVKTPNGLIEVAFTVRSTRHGPLIDALLRSPESQTGGGPRAVDAAATQAEREPLAVAWVGALPGDGLGPLLRVAVARTAAEVVDALALHHEPAIAVVYADREGGAGIRLAGWLPRRTLPTSLVPVPGRLRLFDWRRRIEYDALPHTSFDAGPDAAELPGTRGFIALADGPIGDRSAQDAIEWLWRTGESQRRVERLLAKVTSPDRRPVGTSREGDRAPRLDIRDAMAIQRDLGGSRARNLVPALLRLSRSAGRLRPEALEIAEILEAWDGGAGPGSQGAAAYHLLMKHLADALFRAPFGDALYARYQRLPGVRLDAVVASILVSADRVGAEGGWTDAPRVASAVRESLRKTWVSLNYRLGARRAGWSWGRLHDLVFTSFVGHEPAAQSDLPSVGIGGDAGTIAYSSLDPERGFGVGSASSFRMAIDLAMPDRMLSSLSPGQSEHPGHRHYADGLDRWLAGRPSLLLTSRLLVEEDAGESLLLEPVP